jgi:hypothetical protein
MGATIGIRKKQAELIFIQRKNHNVYEKTR